MEIPPIVQEIDLDGAILSKVSLHIQEEIVNIGGVYHVVGLFDRDCQAFRLDGDRRSWKSYCLHGLVVQGSH